MHKSRVFSGLALAVFLLPTACLSGNVYEYTELRDDLKQLMLEQRILETRISQVEDQVLALYAQPSAVGGAASDKSAPAGKAASGASKSDSSASRVSVFSGKTSMVQADQATEAYQNALKLLEARKFRQAEEAFINFSSRHAQSKFLPNAGYWLGETYYSQQRYDDAILAFQDVVKKYPEHAKAAAALLKTAYSYERLTDALNARFYLQQLLENYPSSEPAALAQSALARLR